ncbi:MAG: ferredoxin--NADP reductase [Gammaproteobacteria bacterium]|nr:ferredoxin--NADP reductase [Gammaproteobacteria bacterium]
MQTWVEGKVVEKIRWNDELYSVRIDAPVAGFEAGQFTKIALDIDGERVGRAYSYVNAPTDPLVEIHFNTVPEGPLTPRLAAMEAGDRLWVVAEPNGFLTLAEVPDRPHLWLLASGTGVGPFVSILRTEAPWRRFERIVVVHAARRAADLAYRDLFGALEAAHPGQFRFVPFVSREATDFALTGRIPDAIADGRLEERAGLPLSPETSNVMVCGNSGLIADSLKALEARGLRRHRRREPGHVITEKYH